MPMESHETKCEWPMGEWSLEVKCGCLLDLLGEQDCRWGIGGVVDLLLFCWVRDSVIHRWSPSLLFQKHLSSLSTVSTPLSWKVCPFSFRWRWTADSWREVVLCWAMRLFKGWLVSSIYIYVHFCCIGLLTTFFCWGVQSLRLSHWVLKNTGIQWLLKMGVSFLDISVTYSMSVVVFVFYSHHRFIWTN